jgi:adenine-specific DNA-methyltransferase
MAQKAPKHPSHKTVATLTHEQARRKNIPTAEYQSVMRKEAQNPVRVAYERRNRDLDPQLVWRGKDEQDWSNLVVRASPLYIQEKVHPKVLIDDLLKQARERREQEVGAQPDLFADFNGMPEGMDKTEFYQHDQNWSNRMILGDSLQVMASLAEREGLRGKVQCIYLDPPYGIKFNSNFQWSTTSGDVKDGNADHITREPEQVKAFRDTWRDGIHSYLNYRRDRLTVARDLLSDSGSIFVQIGDENVHRVRALMDEVFGDTNFAGLITFSKTTGQSGGAIPSVIDYLLWFAKDILSLKNRRITVAKPAIDNPNERYVCIETENGDIVDLSVTQKTGEEPRPAGRVLKLTDCTSQTGSENSRFPVIFAGREHRPLGSQGWSTSAAGFRRLEKAGYLFSVGDSLLWKNYRDEGRRSPVNNSWLDLRPSGFGGKKQYIVETEDDVIARCPLMTTAPGDLVLDPSCGSGTTAYVAEQWGRRWITIDTSRVALALTRARIMGARYPYYLLADSPEGQLKEAEITRSAPSSQPTRGDIRQGFVYERVPHITLKSIANNAEIDVIWEQWQAKLEPLRGQLNAEMGKHWEEWEIPREAEDPWNTTTQTMFYQLKAEQARGEDANTTKMGELLLAINHNLKRHYPLQTLPDRPADPWPSPTQKVHADWWRARIARQKEIDASIAAKAEFEYLYDKPYDDKKRVRVAGPFTVESLSPHRVLRVDENDELIDGVAESADGYGEERDFVQWVEGNYSGPARVSGSAGTGKTIVALHRTVFLARTHPGARVLLTTFSDTLGNALKTRLRRLISHEPRLGERLEVYALNAIDCRLYEAHFGRPRIASRDVIQPLLADAAGAVEGQRFSPHFILTEWEEVVDA